jgi:hypothetical protein
MKNNPYKFIIGDEVALDAAFADSPFFIIEDISPNGIYATIKSIDLDSDDTWEVMTYKLKPRRLYHKKMALEYYFIEKFKDDMMSELLKNRSKGTILDLKDFNTIITELEYHKAKLFLAIRMKNKGAIREYIADTANYLLAIGNMFDLYDEDGNDPNTCFEINKDAELFVELPTYKKSTNQKLV